MADIISYNLWLGFTEQKCRSSYWPLHYMFILPDLEAGFNSNHAEKFPHDTVDTAFLYNPE